MSDIQPRGEVLTPVSSLDDGDRISDTDSDSEMLSPMETEADDVVENIEDIDRVNAVRNGVREWKLREMDTNANEKSQPNGLQGLRNYVAKTARLFYDLSTYIKTSTNTETNMKDNLYVNIITAIGMPAALAYGVSTLLEHILQRDLIELPFTIEPKVINTYAQKGLEVTTEFPDEE